MKIEKMICPNCSANIFKPNGKEYFNCPYCGLTLHFDDGIQRKEYSKEYHYFDEAELNRQRIEENERNRKIYEQEQKSSNELKKTQLKKEHNKRLFLFSIIPSLIISLLYLWISNISIQFTIQNTVKFFAAVVVGIYTIIVGIFVSTNLKNLKYTLIGVGLLILLGARGVLWRYQSQYNYNQEVIKYEDMIEENSTRHFDKEHVYWSGWLNDNYDIGEKGIELEFDGGVIKIYADIICLNDTRQELDELLEKKRKFFCKWEYEDGMVVVNNKNLSIDLNGDVIEIKNYEEATKLLDLEPMEEIDVIFSIPTSDVIEAYEFMNSSDDLKIGIELLYRMNDSNETTMWIE